MISRTYRLLLHLYPSSFRADYGEDMVALLEDQLRDENTLRVVSRSVVDLAITVPIQHLEPYMRRSTTSVLVVAFVSIAAAFTVFGGPVGLAGAVVLLGLSVLVWQRSRPDHPPTANWWRFMLGGLGLLGILVAVTTATGELPSGGWYLAMATLFTSFGLIAAGIILGIASRFRPRAA
jgi:Trk-type K+ transport system membrane component